MDTESREYDAKAALLGTTASSSSGEKEFKPLKSILLLTLPKGAVIRVFCVSCGEHNAVTREGAEEISERVGNFKLPPNDEIGKYFIEVNSCCGKPKGVDELATLRKISDV